jgi:hypothetical protein
VRTQNEVNAIHAAEISESLLGWQELFVDWYEAMNLVNLASRNSDRGQAVRSGVGHLTKGDAHSRVRKNDTPTITIVVSMNDDDAAGIDDLRAALDKASSGAPPPLAYLFLMHSLKFLDAERYRQSVLDSATALELALTEIAHQKLGGPDTTNAKKFFRKHRMLRGLYSGVLTDLHIDLPPMNAMNAAISDPRNDALHEGKAVSDSEASTAYDFVRQILVGYLPI